LELVHILVHTPLKNDMLRPLDNSAKILDFGLAMVTATSNAASQVPPSVAGATLDDAQNQRT
jgi:hypothetical protein